MLCPRNLALANELANRLKEELRKHMKQERLNRAPSLSTEDGSLWRMTRTLRGNRGQQDEDLLDSKEFVCLPEECSKLFAAHFSRVFEGNPLDSMVCWVLRLPEFVGVVRPGW